MNLDIEAGSVKAHAVRPHGVIAMLNKDADYGRISTPQGREIYLHRNSMIGTDFERLKVGADVRLSEEVDERGP